MSLRAPPSRRGRWRLALCPALWRIEFKTHRCQSRPTARRPSAANGIHDCSGVVHRPATAIWVKIVQTRSQGGATLSKFLLPLPKRHPFPTPQTYPVAEVASFVPMTLVAWQLSNAVGTHTRASDGYLAGRAGRGLLDDLDRQRLAFLELLPRRLGDGNLAHLAQAAEQVSPCRCAYLPFKRIPC